MHALRRTVAPALLLVFAVACERHDEEMLSAVDKAAIRAVADSAQKIANTQPLDAATYVKGYYTDDAVFMTPNAPPLNGSAAIVEWLKALPPVKDLRFHQLEIEGGDGTAWVHGAYALTFAPPGGAAEPDTGKYLEVWKKQTNGSWRVYRDAFNSDRPLPGPPPPTAPKKK